MHQIISTPTPQCFCWSANASWNILIFIPFMLQDFSNTLNFRLAERMYSIARMRIRKIGALQSKQKLSNVPSLILWTYFRTNFTVQWKAMLRNEKYNTSKSTININKVQEKPFSKGIRDVKRFHKLEIWINWVLLYSHWSYPSSAACFNFSF